MLKKIIYLIKLSLLALLSALNYCIFIFPNKFAPAGLDGICTMIQDVLDINMGYLSLLVNIPLIFIAFFTLNRDYAVKSTVYIIVFSVSVIFIKDADISNLLYITETGSSTALAPVASGTVRGIIYAYTLKLNGSAGGVDIISSVIKKKKPHLDFMNTIFILNTLVSVSSLWVYGMKIEPVICSILYAYISSSVCNRLRYKETESIKYEIITKNPNEICRYINEELHQEATIIDGKGAFSKQNTNVVLCIIAKEYAPLLEEFLLEYANCVTFKSYARNGISGITYK